MADLEALRIPAAQDLRGAVEVQEVQIPVEEVAVRAVLVPQVVPVQQAVQDLPEVMDQKAVQVPAPAVDRVPVEGVPVEVPAPVAALREVQDRPDRQAARDQPVVQDRMEVPDPAAKIHPLQVEAMDPAARTLPYRIVVTAAVRAIRMTVRCVESQMCSVSSKMGSVMW